MEKIEIPELVFSDNPKVRALEEVFVKVVPEYNDLLEKKNNLFKFISNDINRKKVSTTQWKLLVDQDAAMFTYLIILDMRIQDMKNQVNKLLKRKKNEKY